MANMGTPPTDYEEHLKEVFTVRGGEVRLTWTFWYFNDAYEREHGQGCKNIMVDVYDKKGVCRAEEIEVEKLSKRNQKRLMEWVYEPEGD